MQFDYEYLCLGLGHLTGLETRVYKNGERIHHCSHYDFDPDIAGLIYHKLEDHHENVFYIETDDLLVFGIVKSEKDHCVLVIGPTAQIRPNKQSAVAILYMLNEAYNRLPHLQGYFSNMIPYPFEMFLEILCFVNYALNEEKLAVADLIKSSDQIKSSRQKEWPQKTDNAQVGPINAFQAEKTMLSYVTTGNVEAIQSFMQIPPTGRSGDIAHNEIRQRKNTFICAATIISRAAIAGGIPSEIAFALSDRYIQKAELLNNGGDITTLNMEMLLDYTKRVESLKCGAENSRLAKDIMRYILRNISKKMTISEIADELNVNRSYLCEKFKTETGTTIGDFIISAKIDEAKRMLTLTRLSIAQISDYLAFSSQSYFQTVFKRVEGHTPKDYREKAQTE